MKKYHLDLSAHEYHIRRNGLCTLQVSSAPFSKLELFNSGYVFPPFRLHPAAQASTPPHHAEPPFTPLLRIPSVLQIRVILRVVFRHAR